MHKYLWVILMLASGCASAVEHPALPVSLDTSRIESYRQSVQPLMAMTEAEMLKLIPTQSGLYFVGCVNCNGGMQEGQLSKWDVKEPDVVRCAFCGQAYPSDKYPMDKVLEVKNPRGEVQKYPYYECRPAWWHEKEPYRCYFGARVDEHKMRYMENAASTLARLYALTKDPTCARRAALILHRFSEVFPGYCYHFDYPFQQKVIYEGEVNPKDYRAGYRTARWTWWAYMDISRKLLEAYDLIANSGELEKLSKEKNTNAAADVEKMLTLAAEQVLGNRDDLTNMSPGMWADLITTGRVLGKPDCVHTALGRLRRFLTEQFFYDGSWREGAPSYHSQVMGMLGAVMTAAKGYSDPAGYKDATSGERFDSLDLERDLTEVARTREAFMKMRLPNGRLVPVHDTWWTNGGAALDSSSSFLLPALGHAMLGWGKGADQTQVHLTWSPGYGHIHYDGLSVTLWAKGKELLSDLGYTHTKWREWTLGTAAHNTVVVDLTNQTATPDTYGNLRYFDASDNFCQIVSVDNPQVYPGVMNTYRRTVALVAIDVANSYHVDLFEVEGGKQLDYFLHGSADDPQKLTISSSSSTPIFSPVPSLLPAGYQFTPGRSENDYHMGDVGHAYGYMSNMRQTHFDQPSVIALDYALEQPGVGLRVHTVTEPGDELVLGTNPAIRQAKDDDNKLDQFKRSFAMLRRHGGKTLFSSVIEPYGDEPLIASVKRLDWPNVALALEITLPDRRDIMIYNARGMAANWNGKSLTATAEFALLSVQNGVVAHATVVAGAVNWGGFSLKTEPVSEHRLLGVDRKDGSGSLLVEGKFLPPKETVVTVDHAGKRVSPYTVTSSSSEGQNSRLMLAEDPGFTWNAATRTSQFVFLPMTSYSGEHLVRLTPVAHLTSK